MDGDESMKVDKQYYTRKYARSKLRLLGKLCFYSGAASFYLDYQVWKTHFRLWHPLTWIMAGILILYHGIANVSDWKYELRVDKSKRNKQCSYWSAPKE